jgi:Na+/H+-dicarboxylate symporter
MAIDMESALDKNIPGRMLDIYSAFCDAFEKYMILTTVLGFGGGIYLAKYSHEFSDYMNTLISGLVDGYSIIAPGVIFIILTPSLTRMFLTRRESRFGGYVLKWFFIRKFMACLWAIIFTVLIFNFPFMPERAPSFLEAIKQTLSSMGKMALHSTYFWAMYLSVAMAFVSARIQPIFRALDNTLHGVETAARYCLPLIPFFMIAIGAYIYGLPIHLQKQMNLNEAMEGTLHSISMFGFTLDPNNSKQMVYIYILGSLLIGIACFIWHMSLVYTAHKRVKEFTIRDYFWGYWVKIYPLLWSTSSESISTPLNLYLTKKYAPWVKSSVRSFVVGLGSYMNVNGTLICIYVLGGVVLRMLGVEVSFIEWLLTIPVVMLISYGVPGIPGELVMFAGPLAILLNLPPDIYPVFLAIYLGMQIGLPDSFRTGNNSTDDYLCSIILDDIYRKDFTGENIASGKNREV